MSPVVRVAPVLLIACASSAPTPAPPTAPTAPVAPAPAAPACEEVARAAIRIAYPGEAYPAKQRLVLAACEVDGWSPEVRACVLAATDLAPPCEAPVRAALDQRIGEADAALALAAARLQRAFAQTHALPVGAAGPVPAAPCCAGPMHRCEPGPGSHGTTWDLLGVYPELAQYYRYTYESDGQTFTLRAASDMDCDGTESTFTLTARLRGDQLEVVIDRPARVD